MVVAQSVRRLLPTPEIPGSISIIDNFLNSNSRYLKDENKEKEVTKTLARILS